MTLYCVIFSLLRTAHVLKQWTIDLNLITLLCCLQLTEKGHMFLNNKKLIWILWLCIVMSSAYLEGCMFHKQWTIHLNLMTLYCVVFILLRRAHFHKQWTIDLNVMSLICIFFSLVRRQMVFLNRMLTPKRKVSQSWQPEEVLTPFFLILYLFVLSSFTCFNTCVFWLMLFCGFIMKTLCVRWGNFVVLVWVVIFDIKMLWLSEPYEHVCTCSNTCWVLWGGLIIHGWNPHLRCCDGNQWSNFLVR